MIEGNPILEQTPAPKQKLAPDGIVKGEIITDVDAESLAKASPAEASSFTSFEVADTRKPQSTEVNVTTPINSSNRLQGNSSK